MVKKYISSKLSFIWILALFTLVAGVVPHTDGHAKDTVLRAKAGDRLRIATFNHAELSGEFEVDAAGFLTFPYLGPTSVSGLTQKEIGFRLRKALMKDYLREPRITVQILNRPFYILGDIKKPGRYPYRPGITIVQAVAVAGGYFVHTSGDVLLHLQIGKVREELRTASGLKLRSLARQARLQAERDKAEQITLPKELLMGRGALAQRNSRQAKWGDILVPEPTSPVESIVAHERRIFEQRIAAHKKEVAVLAQQARLFDEEIRALTAQMAAKKKEGKLMDQEIRGMNKLADKGVASRFRVLQIRRQSAVIEADQREIQAFVARAKLNKNRARQEILQLESARRKGILESLATIDSHLAVLDIQVDSARQRLYEAEVATPRSGAPAPSLGARGYVIVRQTPKGPKEISANDMTQIRPGDLIRVPRIASPRS